MRTPLLALTLFVSLSATSQSPQPPAGSPEQTLFQLTNQARAEHHLPALTWDEALAKAAHAHLTIMAHAGGEALHQYPGEPDLTARGGLAGAHFSTIAENVAGSGQSPEGIQQLWLTTPTHRANILDPKLTAIGIAVTGPPGAMYAVQDFGRTVASLAPNSAEQQVQQLLTARDIQPDPEPTAHGAALSNCESGTQPPADPNHQASLVMQWESSDLTQLPAELIQRLNPPNPAKPQTAAVASCAPNQPEEGFTTYRLAVIIY